MINIKLYKIMMFNKNYKIQIFNKISYNYYKTHKTKKKKKSIKKKNYNIYNKFNKYNRLSVQQFYKIKKRIILQNYLFMRNNLFFLYNNFK